MITPKITNLGYSSLWTGMSSILGYKVNFEKLIAKLFANNEQGFAYDPNDLTEEKINWRKNLILYSEEFSSNVWGLSNSSLTVNSITAPDGTMTADHINLIVSVKD